jgi:hypothetical protein
MKSDMLGGWKIISASEDSAFVWIAKPTGERALIRKTLLIDLLRALFEEFKFERTDTKR